MHYFPVICSTLSPAHVGRFVQQQYKLGAGATCRLLRAAINHAYLITDGADRYVFRLYSLNWRSNKEVNAEISLLQLLQDNNIPVSYALPDAQGAYLQELPAPEGPRTGVLFSFAKGEKIFSFGPDMHYKIGEIMARMHQVTHNLTLERITYTADVLLVQPFELIKQYISIDTEEMRFMQKAQQYLLQEFEKINIPALRQGIVHLDIWFDNLHIYDNAEVTIFDFDFCGNGWLMLDIAYYHVQLLNVEREQEQYDLRWEAFLKGYRSIAAITEEEMRILPVVCVSIYFFYLGVQCQRFENWTNSFLNETYLKRYINLVIIRLWNFHQLPDIKPVKV